MVSYLFLYSCIMVIIIQMIFVIIITITNIIVTFIIRILFIYNHYCSFCCPLSWAYSFFIDIFAFSLYDKNLLMPNLIRLILLVLFSYFFILKCTVSLNDSHRMALSGICIILPLSTPLSFLSPSLPTFSSVTDATSAEFIFNIAWKSTDHNSVFSNTIKLWNP